MSLRDMLRIYLPNVILQFQVLQRKADEVGNVSFDVRKTLIPEHLQEFLVGFFDRFCKTLEELEINPALSRRLGHRCAAGITHQELAVEMRTLEAFVDSELSNTNVYYCPATKAGVVRNCSKDWQKTLESFPSSSDDLFEAVGCYASDHNTASVFHLMRVAEHGLRALARERAVSLTKPVEWHTWQDLLSKIENESKAIGSKPAGPVRDDALSFYRGAVAHFHAFKDQYRNNLMHARVSYDESEAMSIMVKIRNFMEPLAEKLTEEMEGPIDWGWSQS